MISSIKTIGIITGTTVSIAAALAVFGVDNIPRPAWASEVIELAGNVTELNSRVTAQQLEDTRLRYYRNLSEQDQYAPGSEPDYLIQEQTALETHMDLLESIMEELRDTGG